MPKKKYRISNNNNRNKTAQHKLVSISWLTKNSQIRINDICHNAKQNNNKKNLLFRGRHGSVCFYGNAFTPLLFRRINYIALLHCFNCRCMKSRIQVWSREYAAYIFYLGERLKIYGCYFLSQLVTNHFEPSSEVFKTGWCRVGLVWLTFVI